MTRLRTLVLVARVQSVCGQSAEGTAVLAFTMMPGVVALAAEARVEALTAANAEQIERAAQTAFNTPLLTGEFAVDLRNRIGKRIRALSPAKESHKNP